MKGEKIMNNVGMNMTPVNYQRNVMSFKGKEMAYQKNVSFNGKEKTFTKPTRDVLGTVLIALGSLVAGIVTLESSTYINCKKAGYDYERGDGVKIVAEAVERKVDDAADYMEYQKKFREEGIKGGTFEDKKAKLDSIETERYCMSHGLEAPRPDDSPKVRLEKQSAIIDSYIEEASKTEDMMREAWYNMLKLSTIENLKLVTIENAPESSKEVEKAKGEILEKLKNIEEGGIITQESLKEISDILKLPEQADM